MCIRNHCINKRKHGACVTAKVASGLNRSLLTLSPLCLSFPAYLHLCHRLTASPSLLIVSSKSRGRGEGGQGDLLASSPLYPHTHYTLPHPHPDLSTSPLSPHPNPSSPSLLSVSSKSSCRGEGCQRDLPHHPEATGLHEAAARGTTQGNR